MNLATGALSKMATCKLDGRPRLRPSRACLSLIGATISILSILFPACGQALRENPEPSASTLAWQSSEPILPPDFDAYFPDDPEGVSRLDDTAARNRAKMEPAMLINLLRRGLRRAEPKIGNQWITWLGQDLWGGRLGEHAPQATELIYHASGRPEYQYSSLYYGLSRVEKTPAILRRMVEIAMGSEDWNNVISHVAWATASDKEKTVAFLSPYQASTRPEVRAHAEVLKQILSGELTAHDHWTRIQTERATEQFGSRMDELRKRMAEGDSAARAELLGTIMQHSLWLIMDDSWIDACQAASSDPDKRVREQLAILVGTRWAWNLKKGESVNPRALELILQISRDDEKDVRQNIGYYALSRIRDNQAVERRQSEMQAEDTDRMIREFGQYARTAIKEGRFKEVESMLHEIRPGTKVEDATVAAQITQFVKEIETELAAARRPNGELQRRVDAAAEGAIIELAADTFKGPLLIEKALTLRGAGQDRTMIQFQGDAPAIMIRGAKNVQIENLSVRWAPATTDPKLAGNDYPAAIAVRDANVFIRSVALEPIDRPTETPYGLMAAGRADVQFLEGRTRGFAYALIWQDAASGKVLDSDLRGAGHSVVTIHPGSKVEVARNLLADCGYHAVRVSGGTIDMHDNIVMNCKRAGAYLGNKDAHGRIHNNLFTGNLGEIWGYYGSDVTIEHNVFYASKDPAIIFWNTCGLVARANSFTQNPGAVRQYIRENDPSKSGIRLEGNHYWQNAENIQPRHTIGGDAASDERFQLADSGNTLKGDPKFQDPSTGDFTPRSGSALLQENKPAAGLLNPRIIHDLARRHDLRFGTTN